MTALARRCHFADKPRPDCVLVGDRKVHPMTMYGDEPKTYWMCTPCALDYVDFWKSQWDDYYGTICI